MANRERTLRRHSFSRLVATTTVVGVVAAAMCSIPTRSASFSDVDSNSGMLFSSDQLEAPTGLTATTGTSVMLTWNATTDVYASGHRVFRATTAGGPYTFLADVTPRTNTTYEDTSAPGEYFYVARAFNGTWESTNSNEDSALVLVSGIADAGGPYATFEGGTLLLDGSGSTNALQWDWDLDGDGQYDDAAGVNPSVSWAALAAAGLDDDGVYPIGLEINGGADTAVASVTISNTDPVLVTTGSPTASVGSTYTLNLDAIDDGDDTITSWTINWGDGEIETFVGDPASVTHVYNRSGFTFQILAAASDEDGAYIQNELVVPSYDGNAIFSFDASSGDYLQQAPSADAPIETIISPTGRLLVSGEASKNVVEHDVDPANLANLGEFVASGAGGLREGGGVAYGPDGHLYIADYTGDSVLKFNGTSGASMGAYVTGLNKPYDIVFGPDSALYVNLFTDDEVVRIDPSTLARTTFVSSGSGGLDTPEQMAFGPDGDLYVASFGSDEVLRFDGATGAPKPPFVASGFGGLDEPTGVVFGPDGNLYVGDSVDGAILRYDGVTGAFIDEFVLAGSGGLTFPAPMTFVSSHRVTIT